MNLEGWLPDVCRLAEQAGERILTIYDAAQPAKVEQKTDGTPVTLADKEADELISQGLRLLTPEIPLVTEESVEEVPFETRKDWSDFWLVDPLDGTKEFIGRTGEFSVNIALIHQGRPVLGVVYVPVTRVLYFAAEGMGAYKSEVPKYVSCHYWKNLAAKSDVIRTEPLSGQDAIRVAVSRRHGSKIQGFVDQLQAKGFRTETVRMGSAIKSCLVAEGKADVYPRFGPTSLWDTAAAQCVVEEAGGQVLDREGQTLRYLQSKSLLNPYFMVIGDKDFTWPPFESSATAS